MAGLGWGVASEGVGRQANNALLSTNKPSKSHNHWEVSSSTSLVSRHSGICRAVYDICRAIMVMVSIMVSYHGQ